MSVLALLAAAAPTQEPPPSFSFRREAVLGTSFHLEVTAPNRARAEACERAVLAEIDRLDRIVSTYREDSELSQLIGQGGGEASDDLLAVLEATRRWYRATDGAFHPSTAGLADLWQRAATAGVPPTDEALSAACEPLAALPFAIADRGVTLKPGIALSLDGLAKGFILDRAARAGTGGDCRIQILDIGGDVVCGGEADHPVAVADPRRAADNAAPLCTVTLRGRAIASSAGHLRGFDVAGTHHSHILDPRTGRPADNILGATVVAPLAVDADALATACNVLPPERALALVESLPDTECLILATDGTRHGSSGWAAIATDSATPSAGAWPEGFELALEFELQDPNAGGDAPRGRGRRGRGGYRRPYVAAWVEDAEGTPVRTLCLWVERLRWLRDLRRWSRHHAEDSELIRAVSQATRKPGVYRLAWDGRDNDGKPLMPGEYTVFLEVTREHGTYQLMRQKLQIAGHPFTHELEGNVEIKAATVRFDRARQE